MVYTVERNRLVAHPQIEGVVDYSRGGFWVAGLLEFSHCGIFSLGLSWLPRRSVELVFSGDLEMTAFRNLHPTSAFVAELMVLRLRHHFRHFVPTSPLPHNSSSPSIPKHNLSHQLRGNTCIER